MGRFVCFREEVLLFSYFFDFFTELFLKTVRVGIGLEFKSSIQSSNSSSSLTCVATFSIWTRTFLRLYMCHRCSWDKRRLSSAYTELRIPFLLISAWRYAFFFSSGTFFVEYCTRSSLLSGSLPCYIYRPNLPLSRISRWISLIKHIKWHKCIFLTYFGRYYLRNFWENVFDIWTTVFRVKKGKIGHLPN